MANQPRYPLCPETLRWAAREALDLQQAKPELEPHELVKELVGAYADHWNSIEGERREAKRRCWYFGTWRGPGHQFHGPDGKQRYSEGSPHRMQPFGYPYDLQPDCGQREGPAALHHRDGWTCLAWWDRHEDTRPGCIGALICEGEHSFASMLKILEAKFERVFKRRRLTPWNGLTVEKLGGRH